MMSDLTDRLRIDANEVADYPDLSADAAQADRIEADLWEAADEIERMWDALHREDSRADAAEAKLAAIMSVRELREYIEAWEEANTPSRVLGTWISDRTGNFGEADDE